MNPTTHNVLGAAQEGLSEPVDTGVLRGAPSTPRPERRLAHRVSPETQQDSHGCQSGRFLRQGTPNGAEHRGGQWDSGA